MTTILILAAFKTASFIFPKVDKWQRSVPVENPGLCPDAERFDGLSLGEALREYGWTKCESWNRMHDIGELVFQNSLAIVFRRTSSLLVLHINKCIKKNDSHIS